MPDPIRVPADLVLLRREGWVVNRKRVRRWYRLDELQLRMRVRRRKHMALHRGPAPVPVCPQERWSMDFVHDTLRGRPHRILTVADQWSHSSSILEGGFRMSGEIVCRVLDCVLSDKPGPRSITVDHGRNSNRGPLEDWAYRWGVQLDFIRPGKPRKMPSLNHLMGVFAMSV